MVVYPDETNTEWISWKKITRKSGGVDISHFRWTSERFSDLPSNFPSLSISPLHISHQPFKLTRRSCPKPLNPTLFAQLPPFTGSIKARNTTAFMNRPKQSKNFSRSFHNASSEMISKTVFSVIKKESKQRIPKKLKKNLRFFPTNKQKLEGIIGKRMLVDSFCEEF